ncbi:MAG: cyclopropane-fatty-acyl-phospholipid synthase family protein [Rhizobiaceae bacterium]
MVKVDNSGAATLLTAENLAVAARGLPRRARVMFAALVQLPLGTLTLTTPDQRVFRFSGRGPGPAADITLSNWRLPGRAFAGGTIGVAESYIDGDWTSNDATALLELFALNREAAARIAGGASRLLTFVQRFRHWMNDNTRTGSQRNIAAHYDLGNAFYREWLDPSMTYSSALFSAGANDLESAQKAKYRALAEGAGIRPGDRVLEIGCGWGGFAEFAAREMGCHVTGLTISREQLEFARERIDRAGLADRVTLKFQDYRDETGIYDRVASIEMFEAVGEKHWPAYFEVLKRCLRPGGTAGLQIITINKDAYPEYRRQPDFIQRYVFPGGMLPTPDILRGLYDKAGFAPIGERIFALDYARTLNEWRRRFEQAWDRIKPLGFDERFHRLWEFYLRYCEAGFRTEYIDVRQVFLKA